TCPVRLTIETLSTGRPTIQQFCPLGESIEWRLGQRYWHERGNQAFLADSSPVPYLVNNDECFRGTLHELSSPPWLRQKEQICCPHESLHWNLALASDYSRATSSMSSWQRVKFMGRITTTD